MTVQITKAKETSVQVFRHQESCGTYICGTQIAYLETEKEDLERRFDPVCASCDAAPAEACGIEPDVLGWRCAALACNSPP